jgi:hypothetical protein
MNQCLKKILVRQFKYFDLSLTFSFTSLKIAQLFSLLFFLPRIQMQDGRVSQFSIEYFNNKKLAELLMCLNGCVLKFQEGIVLVPTPIPTVVGDKIFSGENCKKHSVKMVIKY